MNHELTDERISCYLDGQLSPSEENQVEQLLKQSPAHREMLDELRALRADIQALPRYSLGPDFASRVVAAAQQAAPAVSEIPAATPENVVHLTDRPPPRRHWLYAAVGGLSAAIAAIAIVNLPRDPQKTIAQPEPAKTNSVAADPSPQQQAVDQLLASAHEAGQAVVVRVKMTKDAIRARKLDAALAAGGILFKSPTETFPAAQEVSKLYQEKAQAHSAGQAHLAAQSPPPTAGDVLFVEAPADKIRAALLALTSAAADVRSIASEDHFTSRAASVLGGIVAEGEDPGAAPTSPQPQLPGFAQHLPPRRFPLPPLEATTVNAAASPATQAKPNVAAPVRMLIVVEVVE